VRPAARRCVATRAAAHPNRAADMFKQAGSAAAAAVLALTVTGAPVLAEELPDTVYFGNGCFWGRQKDFVDTEKKMGRVPESITSIVGYAGGPKAGPDGSVCYYYSDPRTVYESLGHAEVVKVNIDGSASQDTQTQFRMFADTYFSQFRQSNRGMQRLDPQDAGPAYRNVVGLPGGVKSPLFKVLQEANVNNMDLREGTGNTMKNWGPLAKASEDDLLNVVWVYDSNALPFYQAEQYHQMHNGIGKAFPKDYRVDLKEMMVAKGLIKPTGCPELPF